ncbi:protein of unknown function DUF81 [Gloeothece citriformis PCC 7424]|uniref:Probable membrane transporter protein n=1 Tax=Gloeothece citriformis (strain PCC 7424) TaxID=65393 RepID=B7KD87_GLOC7|nr:sulfite exporter TauE/SafE family protein [Gloeothece citriformis]ACK68907.1 protein of unknown function DUF81 [Gloeothece citriformis PCC 7424]
MHIYLSAFLLSVLGLSSGLMAGLLGIGGGMVIVPGLFFIFQLMGIPHNLLMHLAMGTSMCVMICTATASTWTHQLKGDIRWDFLLKILPGIFLGLMIGSSASQHLSTRLLECIFGFFLLFVSVKILLKGKLTTQKQSQSPKLSFINLMGTIIGLKSGLLGIGGGAISIPFLIYCGLPMTEVAGTSASFSLPISILGTFSLGIFATTESNFPLSIGYIYWPAVLMIAPFTMFGASIGTKLSHLIPAETMRFIFAWFLLFVSMRMLLP